MRVAQQLGPKAVHARQLGADLPRQRLVEHQRLFQRRLLLGRRFLGGRSLGGAVRRVELVEPSLEREELADLIEIHAEHLAQLQNALQMRQVLGRVATLATRGVERRRQQTEDSS